MTSREDRVRAILRDFLRLDQAERESTESRLLDEHPDLRDLLAQLLPEVRTQTPEAAEKTLDRLIEGATQRVPRERDATAIQRADDLDEDVARTLPFEPASESKLASESDAPLFDGRYRVLRTIGAGGFGRVDLVADTLHRDEILALKVILPQHSDVGEFEGRFRNEITTMRALRHEGIPQIFNDGRTSAGEFYFTMEYVEGEPLEDILEREGCLGPQRIVRLVRQLTAVLDFAHSCGVVHRDLKPANIILVDAGTPTERVNVLDFGIAKILRKEGVLSHAKTMDTMAAMGTPHYMAPEQVRGQDVDEATDYYALGVLIYRMVSSRYPFKGKTAMEIATARIEKDPAPLEVGDTPPELTQLIKSLLERDKEKRAGAEEIKRLLADISKGHRSSQRLGRRLLVSTAVLVAFALLLIWQPWNDGGRGDRGESASVAQAKGPEVTPPQRGRPSIVAGIPAGRIPVSDALELRCTMRDLADREVWIRFDGREQAAPVTDGELEIDVMPREGAGTLEIFVPASDDDDEYSLATVTYWADRTAPVLAFDALPGIERTLDGRQVRFVSEPGQLVTGRASDNLTAEPLFTNGGTAVALGPGGTFSLGLFDEVGSVELTEVLRLAVTDEAGGRDTRALTYYFDPNEPEIAVRMRGADWTTEDAVFAVRAGSVTIETRVDDPHLERAYLIRSVEASEELQPSDEIVLELAPSEETRTYTLVAVDLAANRTERTITLVPRVELGRVAFDGEVIAAQGVFRTTTGSFTVEGSLNRSEDSVRILVGGMELEGDVDGKTFRRDVQLGDPGEYDLEFESLEGRWKIEYALPLTPAGTERLADAPGALLWNGVAYARNIRHARTGIELVLVEPTARYRFGDKTVAIEEPFYFSVTETTWGEYRSLRATGRGQEPRNWFATAAEAEDHPVVNVSFADAEAFCAEIGGRLPTVAEWLHAAGGAGAPEYPWGSGWSSRGHAEGTKTESVLAHPGDVSWCGVRGAAGNVSEWCSEDASPRIRGGSFFVLPEECVLTAERVVFGAGGEQMDVGFRVVLPLGGN